MHGEQRAAWFQRGGGGGPQPPKVDWAEVIAELADHDEVEIAGRKAFEDATALECHMWQVHQAIAGRAQWCLGHIGSQQPVAPSCERCGEHTDGAARLKAAAIARLGQGGEGTGTYLRCSYQRVRNSHGSEMDA
jgi:hypothetical protein